MNLSRFITLFTLSTICILSANLITVTYCHLITLDPHQEECFHEKLTRGTKIKFSFEVLDGGSLDIDLTIKNPRNEVVHTEQKQTSGRYTIEADMDGAYTYCFGNKMSSFAMKIVMFSVDFDEAKKGTEADHDRLSDMVTELTALVTGVKHEMDFLAARDRLHRRISEVINSRVQMWSIFEFLLTLIVAVGQTYYVKRFFEVRRKV